MKLVIANDHNGVALKRHLVAHLSQLGHEVINLGSDTEETTHSAFYAVEACQYVKQGDARFGILICGTGVGMSICANKVNGIRAVLGSDGYTVKQSREHNDTNILALGALTTDRVKAAELVTTWIHTQFDDSVKRRLRLGFIQDIEADQTLRRS